jgi:TPR repeat protein
LISAAHYFKLSADQGNAFGQCCYGICLRDGTGISQDLISAAHYFKLSADQGNTGGQYHFAMCLLTGNGLQRNMRMAIRYFILSAESGNPESQRVVGWMAEHGIGTAIDIAAAGRYYELSADHSSAGAFRFGQCCRKGRGVPIDFTVAAEFFRKAADSGNADGANSFGCCLERGEGVDANIELAVKYFRKAASQSHPSGLYNIGRCFEYGLGIKCDLVRAATYYRIAAEFGNASAQNSFGVFLERGIVFRSNQSLAAHYFELSARQGDSEGANNLGFCLEHGRGVRQDIKSAAEWYRFAADHNHPEGEMNYQRCLRLLGHWNVPDRSSRISDHPQSDDLARLFIACVDEEDLISADRANADLVASIERLKEQSIEWARPQAEWDGWELARGNSIVMLTKDSEVQFTAVKSARALGVEESIQREINILKMINHPLVVRIHDDCSEANSQNTAVVTDFVGNGSLADHLPDGESGTLCQLRHSTRIMKIIAGIVLAMRFIHSKAIIHGDLTPDNILLDFDWNVRICDFGESVSFDQRKHFSPINRHKYRFNGFAPSHYFAPEYYDDVVVPESDVFSFGLILYELIVGRLLFPKDKSPYQAGIALIQSNWCPNIPDTVIPVTAELIRDCLALNYCDRPSFTEILQRLEMIDFKLMVGVNSVKITSFVTAIENQEM